MQSNAHADIWFEVGVELGSTEVKGREINVTFQPLVTIGLTNSLHGLVTAMLNGWLWLLLRVLLWKPYASTIVTMVIQPSRSIRNNLIESLSVLHFSAPCPRGRHYRWWSRGRVLPKTSRRRALHLTACWLHHLGSQLLIGCTPHQAEGATTTEYAWRDHLGNTQHRQR